MENIIYKFFEFGYALIFGFLGLTTFFLYIPTQEKGIELYKKARRTLGIGLTILSIYCIIRIFTPLHRDDYEAFWLLVTFTLIHSWMSYATLLFLLETPRYLTKNFLIDGIIPISLMLILGVIGIYVPSIQQTLIVVFGVVFSAKCLWMCYVCRREYKKCKKELANYYDELPDISWIGRLMIIGLCVSVSTVIAFYVPSIHLIYYLSMPIVYAYFVFRIINFAPKKIDIIRQQNINALTKPAKAKKEKSKDLQDKIGPQVEEWIKDKKFCRADLTIKDVATEIGTNHNYLSQYLNNIMGTTFQVWLNTLRIEESKLLLTDGVKRPIEEIGNLVGIPQGYNFSRWFKIVTDTTPYQYRKANLK